MLKATINKNSRENKMSQTRPRMTHLFEQLGLDASDAAIELFIVTASNQWLTCVHFLLSPIN